MGLLDRLFKKEQPRTVEANAAAATDVMAPVRVQTRLPQHSYLQDLLSMMDINKMAHKGVYLCNDSATVFLLDEYREINDVQFVCTDRQGWSRLHQELNSPTKGLFRCAVIESRKLRATVPSDPDGLVEGWIDVRGVQVKFEITTDFRVPLKGLVAPMLGITTPMLDNTSLMMQKLVTNEKRDRDPSMHHMDIIDLAMMRGMWGPVPQEVWAALTPLVPGVETAYKKAALLASRPDELDSSLRALRVAPLHRDNIVAALFEITPPVDETNLDVHRGRKLNEVADPYPRRY